MSANELASEIADMGEYLRATYVEVERLDSILHELRDRLRNRLFALHLVADSGEFRERVRVAREHAVVGKSLDDAVTPLQFAAEFLASAGE